MGHTGGETGARRPEAKGTYDDVDEVAAFASVARGPAVARVERQWAAEVVARLDGGPRRILDVGTGPGTVPIRIAAARADWSVVGLDASPLMIAEARRCASEANVAIDWRVGMADHLDFPTGTFDAVLSHLVLHEVDDPGAMLREMSRVTRPGGVVLVQDLCRPAPWLLPIVSAAGSLYYLGSARERRQYLSSLRAAYVPRELSSVVAQAIPEAQMTTRMSAAGRLIRIEARKPERVAAGAAA